MNVAHFSASLNNCSFFLSFFRSQDPATAAEAKMEEEDETNGPCKHRCAGCVGGSFLSLVFFSVVTFEFIRTCVRAKNINYYEGQKQVKRT